MKFWKWLARLCTVGFVLLLVVSWIANGHPSDPSGQRLDEPPPAPKFQ